MKNIALTTIVFLLNFAFRLNAQIIPVFENTAIKSVELAPSIDEKGFFWKIKLISKTQEKFLIKITEFRNNDKYEIYKSTDDINKGINYLNSNPLDSTIFDWIFESTDAHIFFTVELLSKSSSKSFLLNFPVSITQKEILDLRQSALLFHNKVETISQNNFYYNFDGRRWSIVNFQNNNNQKFYEFYPHPAIPEYSAELFQIFRYLYIDNEKFNSALKDKKNFFQNLIEDPKSNCKSFKSKILKEDKENLYFEYTVESCNGGKPASYFGRYFVGRTSAVLYVFIYFETEIPEVNKEIYRISLEKQSSNY